MSDEQKIPQHVAMILDGNRRWARKQGFNVIKGHRSSADNIEGLLIHLREKGVKATTLWVFSTENWKRDEEQVNGIMKLAVEYLEKFKPRLIEDEVQMRHLGRKDRIPTDLKERMEALEDQTRQFSKSYLNIALDYGGRDEIIRAVKRFEESGKSADELTEENFNQFLDTHDQPFPDPDLIIRTGGALRMSGFMPYQATYAEYAFLDKYFPEVTVDDLNEVLANFGHRERRFGGGK